MNAQAGKQVDDDWSRIDGVDGWTRKLRELLQEEAALAAREPDPMARLAMSERLTRFVEHSFPNTDTIKALDEIATRAAIGLLEQNIDERLKSMVARNLELAALTKQLEAGSDDAFGSARSIRLTRAEKTLTALNDGVATMRALRASLEQSTDRQLIASLDKAMVATQAVRALLERSGAG
jgi:hypothetical protein